MLDRRDTDQVQKGWGAEAAATPVVDPAASQRAFRFLQELAVDLSAEAITFPTFIDATVRVHTALRDPDIDVDRIARVVAGEPLLATRLVRIANSAALNPGGRAIGDVRTAVMRVGLNAVRSTAAAVAIQQVHASKELAIFQAESKQVWLHSLNVAAIAYVLAKSLTKLNADEALFAGLVHDIGRFYLLSRAAKYPELVEHRDELEAVIAEWHPSIGQAILQGLDLSESLTDAVAEHELGNYRFPPKNLTDVVTLANLAACARSADGDGDAAGGCAAPLPADSPVFQLLTDAANEVQSLVEALR